MIRRFVSTLLLLLAAISQGSAQEAPAPAPSPAVPESTPRSEPTPAPAANPPAPSSPPSQPAPETPKPAERTQSVLGILVHGDNASSVGRLVDVLVDKTGVPREAVLDAGGFLGVGSRRIVVPWQTLHFDPESKDQTIATSMTSDELKAAPEYKGAAHPPPVSVAPIPAPAPSSTPAQTAAPSEPAPAPTQVPSPQAPSPAPASPNQVPPAGIAPVAPAPDSKPAASSQ